MHLATYTTADGEEVTVQVADVASSSELVTRGWGGGGDTVQRAEQGLDGALSRVQPAVRTLLGQLRSQTDEPDEIQIEFGIQLSVGVGAFISAGTSSNFRVLMTWTRGSHAGRDEASADADPDA